MPAAAAIDMTAAIANWRTDRDATNMAALPSALAYGNKCIDITIDHLLKTHITMIAGALARVFAPVEVVDRRRIVV
jgi:hypothetical protein